MKTKFLLAAAILASSLTLQAQTPTESKWYIKPSVSYFFSVTPVEYPSIGGLPSRDRTFTVHPVTGVQATQSESILTGSFGEGLRLSLTGGYRFTDLLGVELGLNYFKSTTQQMSRQTGVFAGLGSAALSLDATGQVTAYDVAPALVFFIPTQSEVFKPYAKVGVIVPVGGRSENITRITDNTGTVAVSQGLFPAATRAAVAQQAAAAYTQAGMPFNTPNPVMLLANVERVDHTKSNPTVGFQSALGGDFWIGKNIALNVEVEYRNVTVASRIRELQSVSGNYVIVDRANNHPATGQPFPLGEGALTLDAASASSRTIHFHNAINKDTHNVVASGEFDPNVAADEVSNRLTFGGLGASFGIKFRF